jgi:uncharacterized protein YecE (DUF72 family)
MEFGKMTEEELKQVDFHLVAEPEENKRILPGKPVVNPRIYIGCAKWGRPEWVGKLYPYKTREKDFLKHYIEQFNSIELNITHYKIYGEKGIYAWAQKAAGKDFKFCPKLFQGITHKGKLKTKRFITNEFFRGISAFGAHLGPIFIQFSDTFSPKRKHELFTYLETLPKNLGYFLEVRHAGWFEKEKDREDLFDFLAEHHIGAVITDTAGRRDCIHMRLTIPVAFIRFVGNSLHPTDYARIDVWVQRIKYWLGLGLEELYFFMHMHDEATSPELAAYLIDKLNEVCGVKLAGPKFIDPNEKRPKPRKSRWSLNLE